MTLYIWTDGSSKPNPGKGGWGAYIIYTDNNSIFENYHILGGIDKSTNNEMELTAVYRALLFIKSIPTITVSSKIYVYSDSTYVINGIVSWRSKWESNNFQLSTGAEVSHKELWKSIYKIYDKYDIKISHVKAHGDCPGNNLADNLANRGGILPNLIKHKNLIKHLIN